MKNTHAPQIVFAMSGLVTLALTAWVLNIKHQIQAVERAIVEKQNLCKMLEKDIRILTSEWATLTRPERIETLSKQFLNQVPVDAARIVTVHRCSELSAKASAST